MNIEYWIYYILVSISTLHIYIYIVLQHTIVPLVFFDFFMVYICRTTAFDYIIFLYPLYYMSKKVKKNLATYCRNIE